MPDLTLADVFRDAVELPDHQRRKADIGKRRPDVPEGRGWVIVQQYGRITRHFHVEGEDRRCRVQLPPWPSTARGPKDQVFVVGMPGADQWGPLEGTFTRAELEAVIGPWPADRRNH